MVSPPKPWEMNGGAPVAAAAASATTLPDAPAVPDRPSTLSNLPTTSAFGQPNPYSSYTSPYSSPYSSTYSPYGGTYGGFGSYGSYGSSYGGGMGMYPGFGSGYMPGGQFGGFNPQASLAQSLESGTQQTFALLGSVVQTFSGVAILGLFGLVSWLRESITGRRRTPLNGEFRAFIDGKPVQGPSPQPQARRGPLIVFLLAAIGVPWAMHRLVRAMMARQAALPSSGSLPPLDASQLTFARATHAFNPQSPSELALKPDEIVAITAKLHPQTNMEVDPRLLGEEAGLEADWWKGRTRDGREGWFPRAFVQLIERKKGPETAEAKVVE
jgi:peroxin-13